MGLSVGTACFLVVHLQSTLDICGEVGRQQRSFTVLKAFNSVYLDRMFLKKVFTTHIYRKLTVVLSPNRDVT